MTRTILALAALLALPPLAAAETDAEFTQKLVGTWGESAECDGERLVFRADGTFNAGDDRSGTFLVRDGQLTGKVGDREMPVVKLRVEGESIVLVVGADREDKLVRCATP